MSKKKNLSKIEQEERKRKREQERLEKWLKQFECIGMNSYEEIVELLYLTSAGKPLPTFGR